MCVYIYVCIYIGMYVCVHMYMCVYKFMFGMLCLKVGGSGRTLVASGALLVTRDALVSICSDSLA